jgi:Skp family chaperone for outer membrane proteins
MRPASGYPDGIEDPANSPEPLPDEARTRVDAVDAYLAIAIEEGRPIEALSTCRALGTVIERRTKEAAQAAVESAWSWADVGDALGVSKQAAHEKLSHRFQRVQDKLDRNEQEGHERISEHAEQARKKLSTRSDQRAQEARAKIDQRERDRHDKLTMQMQASREKVARREEKAKAKLAGKLGK